MAREDARLSQPPREFVDLLACRYPGPDHHVARGFSAETYLIETVPAADQAALMAYLVDLLDGAPVEEEDLRALMNRNSAWWGFEIKCARGFLEGLRGSLAERMKPNA